MKKRMDRALSVIKFLLIGILVFLVIPLLVMVALSCLTGRPFVVCAEESTYSMPFRMESTAYCHGEITATGDKVREGIAAARKEWRGLTAVLYEDNNGSVGELIGIYEILDTGGDERIKNGTCIDVYLPDYQKAKEYGRKNVWVQLVEAKG